MSSNMLQPKKTHRVRNFFLILAVLFVGIIVIANLQPAKHSTNPQTTTQPAPAPVAASPQPAPAPVAASPQPAPAPAAATDYKISIATLLLEGSKVKVDIITNVPGEIEVVADLTIVGQAPDDTVIGTRGEYILIHNGEGQTILDGSTLPTGEYEVEVSLYPRWGLKDDVSKACGLKQDLGYSISARALVTLTGTGESAEVVKKRNQGQRWVKSNVFVGTKWDPSSWVAKFGSWEELKLTSGNPQILKMLYFESIDMTLTVNVLKGEIVTWQSGKASSQATTQLTPTPVAASNTNDTGGSTAKKVEAWVATRFMIEDRLVAPSTAKFHGGAWNVVYLRDNRYRVEGSVDSQNSFGAMIRTTFQAIVRDEGDEHQTWVLEDLQTSP